MLVRRAGVTGIGSGRVAGAALVGAGVRPGDAAMRDRLAAQDWLTTVVELDLAQQQIGVYGGGYEAYLTEREVARRHAREEYDEYAGKLSDLQDRAQMQRIARRFSSSQPRHAPRRRRPCRRRGAGRGA